MAVSLRRRLIGAGSISMVGVLAIAGCGSSSAPPKSSGSTSPTTSSAPTASGELTIWAEDYYVKIFQPLVDTWAAKTGIKVTFVTKDFGKMGDEFVQAVPTGAGPDLFITPSDTAKFVSNGVVAPVQLGSAADGFSKLALNAFTDSGQLYGVPFDVENIALYRNTKLVPSPVSTFDDAIKQGKALVAAGKAKTAFGIGLDPKEGNPYLMMPLQTSLGSEVFGKDATGNYDPAQLVLDDAAGQKFAQSLSAWGKSGSLNPNLTLDIALSQFNAGQMPFYLSGPWDLGAVKKSGVKYAIDTIPTTGQNPAAPFAGFYGVVESAKAKNPLAASLFLTDFMTQKDSQVGIWKGGQNPPALTAALDEVSSDPNMKSFGAVGAIAQPTPGIKAMNSVWGPWGETEMLILRGQGGDPVALWKAMGAKIRAAIAKG